MMKGKPLVCIDCETDILKFGQNGVCELTYGKTYYVIETYDIRFYTLINDNGISNDYLRTRFVTPDVFREMRLKEIGIE
jgi:hypothetical protein